MTTAREKAQARWDECYRAMLEAARAWRKANTDPLAIRLPPDDTWIVGALCDETIPLIAINEATRRLLKHVEAVAEPLGGATFMHGVDLLRDIMKESYSS